MSDADKPDGWMEEDRSGLPTVRSDNRDAFHILSSRRRRIAILLLQGLNERPDIGRLATLIAAIEDGDPPRLVSSDARKRCYIAMQQTHLPKMKEADLVALDDNNKITVTPRLKDMHERLVEDVRRHEPNVEEEVSRVVNAVRDDPWQPDVPVRPSMFRVPTGEQLRALRKSVGATQVELAKAADMPDASTLGEYERTGSGMSTKRLRRVVEALRRADT